MVLENLGFQMPKNFRENYRQFWSAPSKLPPALFQAEQFQRIMVFRGSKLLTCPGRPHFSARSCIYLLCVHKRKKAPFSIPKNQHFNYVTRSITTHKTSCLYIRFWKWIVPNHSGSMEVNHGCGRVSHFFQRADQHVCLWYLTNS